MNTAAQLKPQTPEMDNSHELGIEIMDRHHDRFLDLLGKLLRTSDDKEFADSFAELHEATKAHFDDEKQLMEQCHFPATREHIDEHLRILGELKMFQERATHGPIAFARAYAHDRLGKWFSVHLLTMDAALAAHLERQ